MAPTRQSFPIAAPLPAERRNGAVRSVELAPLPAPAGPAPDDSTPDAPASTAPSSARPAARKAIGAKKAAARKTASARKAPAKRAPAKRPAPDGLPVWVRRTTSAAVIAVAVVAAIVSYEHMRTLADRAGEGWRAFLLPISVDGLTVAASMTMLVRRQAGEDPGWLARFSLALGLGASLAANVVAADPTLVDPEVARWVVAAWPPVALGLGYELLIRQMRPAGGGSGFHTRRRPGAVEPLDTSRPTTSRAG